MNLPNKGESRSLWISVCSPAKGAGWDGDLPLTLPPSCDSPASPVWFRTHHPPPTLPKPRLPPTPSIPEGMALPFPVHVLGGGAWQALGSRQGQEVREQSQPFKPPARREHWPAASLHSRPRYREVFVWGTQVCI